MLEDFSWEFVRILVKNNKWIKNVLGRKTLVSDCSIGEIRIINEGFCNAHAKDEWFIIQTFRFENDGLARDSAVAYDGLELINTNVKVPWVKIEMRGSAAVRQ